MKRVKLGIIGFGTVGQGFAEILANKKEQIEKNYNTEITIVGIADPVKGSVYNKKGIDLRKALEAVTKGKKIDDIIEGEKEIDSIFLASKSNADIIAEATPTNIENGEPGYTHIKTALSSRKHIITTNKGPIALFYHELRKIACNKKVYLKFEGTVLAGTPSIDFALNELAGCNITEIRGIVNGTTNYILTKMEEGKSYEEALKDAQAKGYAEAKPDADVEGFDALAKVLIMANVIMGMELKKEEVERVGITGLTLEDIESAKKEGLRWKLIARLRKDNGKIIASVKPEKIGKEDPLYYIEGATNGIVFSTDHLGEVFIKGPGAGRIETGQALLHDLLYILREI